jgi:diguanylate cyclase (GGDEF)-like protein
MRPRHTHAMQSYFSAPHARAMAEADLQLLRRDGQVLPVDISLGHWQGQEQRYAIAYIRDLTDRKTMEAALRRQATHDELTGLPNRWFLNVQLDQALGRSQRTGLRLALLLLDLDYFKTINDSFGHAAGDALLVQVAQRIGQSLRENDVLARLGGDEFVILLADLASVDEAVSVAAKLLNALQAVYPLDNKEVYSGASLGLAFYPDDAQDSATLLRYADMAMYQAKNAGRGGYACYSQEMDRRVHEDMQLHTRLKEAIAQGSLKLHYQPQVNVNSNQLVGAEALLRWHDAELGDVSPLRCIAVAEATGLIRPLSDWVLLTACQQIAAWQCAGTPIRVAVNFSAQLFRQRNLVDKVAQALAQTGAQACWLEIEITESVAMDQGDLSRQHIETLVALGCSVALDDFGTGYSSLSYLKTLPVSTLKIDKTFMDGVPHDANDVSLSRTIIALAHNLGLKLVAEGVETQAQLDFLRRYGCETYQGWLYAKAMDAAELGPQLVQTSPMPTTI